MFKSIEKYQNKFKISNANNKIEKVFFAFMLSLPHILVVLILTLMFPEQFIGIIIIGLILPDLLYFLMIATPLSKYSSSGLNFENIKKVCHILSFVVTIFLLIQGNYILFIAGITHMLFDVIGF